MSFVWFANNKLCNNNNNKKPDFILWMKFKIYDSAYFSYNFIHKLARSLCLILRFWWWRFGFVKCITTFATIVRANSRRIIFNFLENTKRFQRKHSTCFSTTTNTLVFLAQTPWFLFIQILWWLIWYYRTTIR